MLRGHRLLRRSGRLESIAELKHALTAAELVECRSGLSRLVFGAAVDWGERAVRQYLLIRVAGLSLNRSLLYALGEPGARVVHPLPASWRRILRRHGFAVAERRSAAAWWGYIALIFGYGVLALGSQLAGGARERRQRRYEGLGRHAYFSTLSAINLPQPSADGVSHDIVSWYAQWPGRLEGAETLCHGVMDAAACSVRGLRVIPVPAPVRPLTRPAAMLRLFGWGLAATALAIADCIRGRWWHALMLAEAASAAATRQQEPGALAGHYLFHNSGWIYRPLWTYEAERLGSRVIFYFYSTNCEPFKRDRRYPPTPYGWGAMSWPRYLVWNEGQADFVRRAVGEGADVDIVGSIWFSTSAASLPALEPPTLAVFDVQPVRDAFYETLCLDFDYYVPAVANRFFGDLHAVAQEAGCALAIKRKRQIGKLAHPRYRRFMKELEGRRGIVEVDPGASALRLIEGCAAVVSMPYTSTALLGRELGKPSAYYDPSGVLEKDDRAAHGIRILSSPGELRDWLRAALRETRESGD